MNFPGYFELTEVLLADLLVYPRFAITYGMEAIIPKYIGMPTIQTGMPNQENAELVIKDLDMVNELRESTAVRIASYQRHQVNSYNKWVKP